MSKPLLCLDFDGVCHSYTSGWKGATTIPDPPVEGMWRFLEKAFHHFTLAIYSARSHQEGGIAAMQAWFLRHATSGFQQDLARKWLTFPQEKPAAFLTLDDRALCFTGQWPAIETLRDFRPWNTKGTSPLGAMDFDEWYGSFFRGMPEMPVHSKDSYHQAYKAGFEAGSQTRDPEAL